SPAVPRPEGRSGRQAVLPEMTLMKFAFLIHYLSDETRSLMRLDRGGPIRRHWGLNVLEFCSGLRQTMEALRRGDGASDEAAARPADELAGPVSPTRARAAGPP